MINIRGDCRTCEHRPDNRTNLQIETQHAEELLGNLFAGGLTVVAIGLLIASFIWL
ncbi:MAG: hypothetical protein WC910_07250 [Bacteroidales bacterium]|jgi:hypothetical protein